MSLLIFSTKISSLEYTFTVRKESLANSNKYLKIPSERHSWIVTAVLTSTSIEGVHIFTSKENSDIKRPKKK